MNEHIKNIIHKEAEHIKAKLAGGKIYGESIDFSDEDMLIVAAHFCGCIDQKADKKTIYSFPALKDWVLRHV